MLTNTIRVTNYLLVLLSAGFIFYNSARISMIGTMPHLSFSAGFSSQTDEMMTNLYMAQILLILSLTAIVLTELINLIVKSGTK